MKWLLVLVFLCGTPVIIQADSTALRPLLEKAGARYERLTEYVIEIEKTSSGHVLNVGLTYERPVKNKILLVRSGPKIHYETAVTGLILTWITNGEQTWKYRPDINEYTVDSEMPAAGASTVPVDGLPRLEWDFVSKFRALRGLTGNATLVQEGLPPDSICPGSTDLVKLEFKDPKELKVQLLRIDTESGLVCHMREERTRTLGGTPTLYVHLFHWQYKAIDEAVEESWFTFVPPKHAKQVRRFSRQTPPE